MPLTTLDEWRQDALRLAQALESTPCRCGMRTEYRCGRCKALEAHRELVRSTLREPPAEMA